MIRLSYISISLNYLCCHLVLEKSLKIKQRRKARRRRRIQRLAREVGYSGLVDLTGPIRISEVPRVEHYDKITLNTEYVVWLDQRLISFLALTVGGSQGHLRHKLESGGRIFPPPRRTEQLKVLFLRGCLCFPTWRQRELLVWLLHWESLSHDLFNIVETQGCLSSRLEDSRETSHSQRGQRGQAGQLSDHFCK